MSRRIHSESTGLPTSATPLSEREHQSLVIQFNDTSVDYPADKTIIDLFEAQAQRTPNLMALVFEGQRLTYSELDRRASLLANTLKGFGVGPDVLVGLLIERSAEMIVGLLGILKAGGAYLPMDTAFPQERIAFMLADANVKVLVTQSNLLSALPTGAVQAVCLDTFDWAASDKPQRKGTRARPDNLAYVVYTSGSTGRPKGVCVEHRHLVDYVLGVGERTFELRNLKKFPNKLKYFWACTVCGNKHYIDA